MHEAYSQYYADLWRRHWWWQVRHEVVMRELSHLLPPVTDGQTKPQILDIGCAGGVAFDDFSRFGDVRGLEPDTQLVDSSPHWRSRIEQRPFAPDYLPGCQFDVITMLDVLEHIENDVGALDHLFMLLKPGGSAILTVPAMWWLTSIHDEINLHFRRYHRRPFKKMLLKAGFQILKMRYMFGWSVGLVYLRTWLRPKNIQEYHVDVPFAPVNAIFASLTRFENAIVNTTGLSPLVGSSLLAVVRRAE